MKLETQAGIMIGKMITLVAHLGLMIVFTWCGLQITHTSNTIHTHSIWHNPCIIYNNNNNNNNNNQYNTCN